MSVFGCERIEVTSNLYKVSIRDFVVLLSRMFVLSLWMIDEKNAVFFFCLFFFVFCFFCGVFLVLGYMKYRI